MLDPANPDIHAQVGRRKLAGGDVAGAIDSFQKAVQMDPQRVAFYVELANAMLRREGGAKQAIEALKAASGRLAGNARIVKLLGDAYRADGDLERARAEYEKALSMEKRFPDARLSLARVWRERRDWARALDELDKAAKEYGEGTTGGAGRAYVEMAEVEAARGARPEVVDELYKRALRADATNCTALWVLGRERADRRSAVLNPVLLTLISYSLSRIKPISEGSTPSTAKETGPQCRAGFSHSCNITPSISASPFDKIETRKASFFRMASTPVDRIKSTPAPSPAMPGVFSVPLSYLSGMASGCPALSE